MVGFLAELGAHVFNLLEDGFHGHFDGHQPRQVVLQERAKQAEKILVELGGWAAVTRLSQRRRNLLEELADEIVAGDCPRPHVIDADVMDEEAPARIASGAIAALGVEVTDISRALRVQFPQFPPDGVVISSVRARSHTW